MNRCTCTSPRPVIQDSAMWLTAPEVLAHCRSCGLASPVRHYLGDETRERRHKVLREVHVLGKSLFAWIRTGSPRALSHGSFEVFKCVYGAFPTSAVQSLEVHTVVIDEEVELVRRLGEIVSAKLPWQIASSI